MKLLTYPARPFNGGRFGLVSKGPVHLWSAKLNGWRALVHTPTSTVFNRHGEVLSIADQFAEALGNLRRSRIEWLDTEALERRHAIGKGSLMILDAIVPYLTAMDRYRLLREEAARLNWPTLRISDRPEEDRTFLVEQTPLSDSSTDGRLVLMHSWEEMQCINREWKVDFYEGLVAKRVDSIYPIQLRSPQSECPFWIKHRWAW